MHFLLPTGLSDLATLDVAGVDQCGQEGGEKRIRETLGGIKTVQAKAIMNLSKVETECEKRDRL